MPCLKQRADSPITNPFGVQTLTAHGAEVDDFGPTMRLNFWALCREGGIEERRIVSSVDMTAQAYCHFVRCLSGRNVQTLVS